MIDTSKMTKDDLGNIKITAINMALYYKITTNTLREYRLSKFEGLNNRYNALREGFIKFTQTESEKQVK